MCYHYSPAHLSRLQKLYPDKYEHLEFPTIANGFSHPTLPVVYTAGATTISWGLIPHWVKDMQQAQQLAKMCLNAKIETVHQKPAFRAAVTENWKCIVPASCFFEWHWEDAKGKQKTKYAIKLRDNDFFYFGGLYSRWLDHETAEMITSFTIITCPANELMSKIHNTKKRMPTLLAVENAKDWLHGAISLPELAALSQQQPLEANRIS